MPATSPPCHELAPILISSHSNRPSDAGGAGARTRSTGMSKGKLKGKGGSGRSAGGPESSSDRGFDGDEWSEPEALDGLIGLVMGAVALGPRVCTGDRLHSR